MMNPLRDQMLGDLQWSGAKPNTQKSYLREVDNLAKYFNRSPEELGEAELKEYLLYLIKERHLSEVPSLLAVTPNLQHKAILMITYSSGLRASETARLKITDIDRKRMTVRITQGKRGKDRSSILSQTTLELWRPYWRKYPPQEWLFPGAKENDPLSTHSIQLLFYKAKKRAGLTKPASVHTLRHSFTTHLIEAGTSLHPVQLLPGHRSPTTTTVYLPVSRLNLAQGTSPLDRAAQPLS